MPPRSLGRLSRAALRGGESITILSSAYEKILDRARVERERENEAFGRLLVEWNRNPSHSAEIIAVEEVISKVVAPIAESARVLLLVLDWRKPRNLLRTFREPRKARLDCPDA